jgi:hypothetical protein
MRRQVLRRGQQAGRAEQDPEAVEQAGRRLGLVVGHGAKIPAGRRDGQTAAAFSRR